MDNDTKDKIWEELKLLQPKIDKIDDFTFRIKNWFITIFIALTGYSISSETPNVLILNIFLILIFYVYEVTYRMVSNAFLTRSRNLERILREGMEISDEDKSPNIDRHLPSHYPLKLTYDESIKRLAQYRISLIYLAAIVINLIIAVLFYKSGIDGITILISAIMIACVIYINSSSSLSKEENYYT